MRSSIGYWRDTAYTSQRILNICPHHGRKIKSYRHIASVTFTVRTIRSQDGLRKISVTPMMGILTYGSTSRWRVSLTGLKRLPRSGMLNVGMLLLQITCAEQFKHVNLPGRRHLPVLTWSPALRVRGCPRSTSPSY